MVGRRGKPPRMEGGCQERGGYGGVALSLTLRRCYQYGDNDIAELHEWAGNIFSLFFGNGNNFMLLEDIRHGVIGKPRVLKTTVFEFGRTTSTNICRDFTPLSRLDSHMQRSFFSFHRTIFKCGLN